MFAGIIETQVAVLELKERAQILEVKLEKPKYFNDLSIGDSISVNGVCLTIERVTERDMTFALAAETLQVTQWSMKNLMGQSLNVERSLPFGERIHGHLVSGHVDGLGRVVDRQQRGEGLELVIAFDTSLVPVLWKKGGVTVNGVALTLNEVADGKFQVCLVPETLKRTNLGALKVGDTVNLEADMLARGLVHWLEQRELQS